MNELNNSESISNSSEYMNVSDDAITSDFNTASAPDNSALYDAMSQFNQFKTDEAFKIVLAGLIEYVDQEKTLYIPITVRQIPNTPGQILTDKLIDENGDSYYTAFTDKTETVRNSPVKRVLELTVRKILTQVINAENIQGLLINPYSENKTMIDKELCQLVLSAAENM